MTQTDPPARRAALDACLRALASGEVRPALDALLQLDPRDAPVRIATAIAWSVAGNFHRACEELATLQPEQVPPGLKPNFDAALATVQAGRERERRTQSERLAANLRLLAAHQPDLAERMTRERLPDDWSWMIEDQVLRFLQTSAAGLLPMEESCGDREISTLEPLLLELAQTRRALLFGALKHGRMLEKAVALHPDLVYGMRIPYYVLEGSTGLFAVQLRCLDFAGFLAQGNVRFFVGQDAVEQLGEMLRLSPALGSLGGAVHLDDPDQVHRRLQASYQPAAAEEKRSSDAVREAYEGLTAAQLLERFDRHPQDPLRVLCPTSRFTSVLQYSSADAARAFESLGCRARILMEDSPIGRITSRLLSATLAEFRPDLIFLIDHLRAEIVVLPQTIPCITWIQDPLVHLFEPSLVRKTTDLDFVYVVTPEFQHACGEAGYRDVRIMPMAANGRIYQPTGRVDPALACDIAFPSNVVMPREPAQYPGLLARLLAHYESSPMRHSGERSSLEVLRRAEQDLGLQLTDAERRSLAEEVCVPAMRYTWRTPPIRWAREEGLEVKLFGRGWETIPDLCDLSAGPIEPGERLRDLYESARITLHLNEGLNLHQRVFEGLAAGGFVLVRELPSDREPGQLADHLEIGREVVTFRDRKDFLRTVRHYLAHEDERRRVAVAGRARVLAEHTYERRMEAVLRDIRERLRRLCTA